MAAHSDGDNKRQAGYFHDRREAGRSLASKLGKYADRQDLLVLGLGRDGIPVAYEIARSLNAPLDVFLVQTFDESEDVDQRLEAITSGGLWLSGRELQDIAFPAKDRTTASRSRKELEHRERYYRNNRPAIDVGGRTVILVDDGSASTLELQVAVTALRKRYAHALVIATPVAVPALASLKGEEVGPNGRAWASSLEAPPNQSVRYQESHQTSDVEVRELLQRVAEEHTGEPNWS